jgi:hypothetical protein
VLGLQTVSAEANWHDLQHSSLESSQTAVALKRQVVGSQHALSPQPSTPPQSQSSPSSTIPFPHCRGVIVMTPLLSEKHSVLTLERRKAEQILPIEHWLN